MSTDRHMILLGCLILLVFLSGVSGQRIAILDPEKTPQAARVVDDLSRSLSKNTAVIDSSLGEAAFLSEKVENPFNLSLAESKRIGSAIGCNAFLLVRAETLRRASSAKSTYFESYAAIFLVSSRSGHLIWWRLVNAEADNADDSERKLFDLISPIAGEMSNGWKKWIERDALSDVDAGYPEIPVEGSPEAKNFRAPIPYLRIKPEYTGIAFLYGVKGTVEIMVDLDEKGNVVKTEIIRWAGFGLDGSVINVVRKMNWRPAERDGRPLPMRFLLRYNFKKIEKD